jgi:hypothetical protein
MSKSQPPPQQQPLPQSVILGCNAFNCASKISNANWETKLNEQVNVNQGDSIGVKASFIDTRGTASGNIVLTKDTEISLEYYFYWVHTFNSCNGPELSYRDANGVASALDASNIMVQQVLVGRDIETLITQNKTLDISGNTSGFPSYFTLNSAGHDCQATSLNDADGLPYIVYQTISDIPVAPIFGAVLPASQIDPPDIYVIKTAGITTNWEYAGATFATKNKIPAGLNLNNFPFTSTNNPNGLDVPALSPIDTNPGLPPSAFLLPVDVSGSLPYVSYIITNLGNTEWNVIDPSAAGLTISASAMTPGNEYVINDPGDLVWTTWGAANNLPFTRFTFDGTPPAPPVMPLDLSNNFWLANAAGFVNGPNYVYGSDASDEFECVVDVSANGTLYVSSFSGFSDGGGWLNEVNGNPGDCNFYIQTAQLGFSAATPNASTEWDFQFTAEPNTQVKPVTYVYVDNTWRIDTIGGVDGSSPVFLWSDLTTDFLTADTSTMVSGSTYQVVEYNGVVIPYAPAQGVLGDYFTSQGPIPVGSATYVFDLNTPNLDTVVLFTDPAGGGSLGLASEVADFGITIVNNGGLCAGQITNGQMILTNQPFASACNISINGRSTTNPFVFNLTFTTGTAFGQITSMTVSGGSTPNFPPGAVSNLIAVQPGQAFISRSVYTGTGSTSTVIQEGFQLATCILASNVSYIDGTVNESDVVVGSTIRSLNPDPVPGSSGRAALVPSANDGTVQDYIPATVRTDTRPVKKKFKMNLKAGSYDPNNLAELITRNMSRQKVKRVNKVTGGPFGNQSTLNVPTDSIYDGTNIPPDPNNQQGIWANPNNPNQNTFYDSKNPKVYDFPPEIEYNIQPDEDDMPFLLVPSINSSILNQGYTTPPNVSNNDYVYATIPHPNANGLNNLPTPPPYYINLIPLISDVRSVSRTIPTTVATDGYYSILPFYSHNALVPPGDGESYKNGNSGLFPVQFGATQTSLLYNNEGNNLFSFNYLHSPILAFLDSATSDLTECSAHMYTSYCKSNNMSSTTFYTTLIDKKSGILLNKMEPVSFWSQLGFDVASIVTELEDKPLGFQMTLDEFERKTTGAFTGSSDIFNPQYKSQNASDQPSVPDTELLYLYATVPQAVATPFNAYSPEVDSYSGGQGGGPGLIPGTQYKIVALGTWADGPGVSGTQTNWDFCNGPENAQPGDIFTAQYHPVWGPAYGCGVWPGWPSYGPGIDPIIPLVFSGASCELANPTPDATDTYMGCTYFQTQNTNSINAVGIPTVRDQTGHYLIEITGYNSIYLDDKSKREIKSIVSSYFVSQGSFVAQVFPESYNYYHVGAPISLSNLKIRILDPFTMEEAQIGPNSSVYIQVNKMLSDLAVAQVEN